jgi:hypothetical protein
MVAKPDVEGNCGKSQLIDVASTQGPNTDASLASSPVTAAEASFARGSDQAMPTASGANGLTGETARGDESSSQAPSNSRAASVIAFGGEGGKPVTAGAIVAAFSDASDSPSLRQPAVVAAVAPVSVSDPLTTAANVAAAGPLAVAGVKSEKNAGKPLAAERYYRADIAGLAVLAFVGQYLGQRWPRPAPVQPRPITIRHSGEAARGKPRNTPNTRKEETQEDGDRQWTLSWSSIFLSRQ